MARLAGSLAEDDPLPVSGRPAPHAPSASTRRRCSGARRRRLARSRRPRRRPAAAAPRTPTSSRRSAETWCSRSSGRPTSPPRTGGCSTPSPPSWRRPRERAACREADRAGRAGRGQRPAHRPAPGRVPRPAHAAGVDQGVGHEPPPARRRPGPGGRRPSSSRRSTRRPTGSTALVGNLLDMSRLQAGALAASAAGRSASRRSCPARWRGLGAATAAGVEVDVARDAAPRRRRPGAARAGRRQPGRQRPRLSPPEPGADRGRRGRRPASTCGSSTGPGHPRRRPRAGVRAVPAPRSTTATGVGLGPGRRPRLRRGDGRRARARGHARRRHHDGRRCCRWPGGRP